MSQDRGATVNIRKPLLPKNPFRFFVQSCQEEQKRAQPDVKVKMVEFSQQCAQVWKGLTGEQKRPFQAMAEKDKLRYQEEMEGGNFPVSSRKRRIRRVPKDPNAPKKFLTAFFWFCKEERENVKAKFPDHRIQDISKELAKMWAEVPPETKQRFQKMSEMDKERYAMEVKQYKQRLADRRDNQTEDEDDDEEDESMDSESSQ